MNGSNLETVNSRKINTLAGTPGHLAESALFFVSRSEFARQYQKKKLYPVPKGNMRCTSWKRIYQVHAFSLMFCENQSKTPSSFVHGNNILSENMLIVPVSRFIMTSRHFYSGISPSYVGIYIHSFSSLFVCLVPCLCLFRIRNEKGLG